MIGLKIIDIFTDLREEVKKVHGQVDQNLGALSYPVRASDLACVGCWLANKYRTMIHANCIDDPGYSWRSYSDGLFSLAKDLGFAELRQFDDFLEAHKDCWHNGKAQFAFNRFYSAYIREEKDYILKKENLNNICSDWIEFGLNLNSKGI